MTGKDGCLLTLYLTPVAALLIVLAHLKPHTTFKLKTHPAVMSLHICYKRMSSMQACMTHTHISYISMSYKTAECLKGETRDAP